MSFINFIDFIDSQLLLLANSSHSVWADQFMMMFSGKFIWVPMYVALVFIIFRQFGWRKALIVLVGVGLAITLADQICATLIRPYVERLRPSNLENPLSAFVTVVNGYRAGAYGFPSCHASNSFALVAFMSLMVPRRRLIVFLLLWAVVNCYSRMYLGVHYPGDILVGGCVGALCGAGVALAVRRIVGMPLPRWRNGAAVMHQTPRVTLVPQFSQLSMMPGGVSLRVSDVAIAVGFATVLVMAAIAV